jgi:hypothetical protein
MSSRPHGNHGERPGVGYAGNGDLLDAAEQAGFNVVVTADKNMRYQQRLEGRRIALVVLGTLQWPIVKLHLEKIAAAVNAATAGTYIEVELSA